MQVTWGPEQPSMTIDGATHTVVVVDRSTAVRQVRVKIRWLASLQAACQPCDDYRVNVAVMPWIDAMRHFCRRLFARVLQKGCPRIGQRTHEQSSRWFRGMRRITPLEPRRVESRPAALSHARGFDRTVLRRGSMGRRLPGSGRIHVPGRIPVRVGRSAGLS